MKVSAEALVAVPDGPAQRWADDDAAAVSRQLDDLLPDPALFRVEGPARLPGQRAPWRLSPEPFWLSPELVETLERLGTDLLAFYQACNRLYQASVRGRVPAWVAEYLDAGRPDEVVRYGRMNRFRRHTPLVIRPDLFLTDQGLKATELDSVPGGMGFTASLAQAYAALGYEPVGGARGMVERFAAMAQSAATTARDAPDDGILAIVVSEESADYWPEMQWLAAAVDDLGVPAVAVRPEEVVFTEEHLQVPYAGGLRPVSVVYRFFELFDLPNIPKYELILYAAKKGRVAITPPLKSYLEEKLLFALFHHPVLAHFWREQLGAEVQRRLEQVIPETWVLDPAPLPPAATIPGLRIADRPVQSWDQLRGLTRSGGSWCSSRRALTNWRGAAAACPSATTWRRRTGKRRWTRRSPASRARATFCSISIGWSARPYPTSTLPAISCGCCAAAPGSTPTTWSSEIRRTSQVSW